jgi:hypothetical protein
MGIETLAIASLGASVIGGGVSAMGASATADANSSYNAYKAGVARNNAIIAERNAVEATHAGEVAASTNDMKTRTTIGTQIVNQAANGLDVGSGTNKLIQDSARDLGHLDTLTILHNAAKNAAGFRAQGMNFTAESLLDDAAAKNAKTAGEYSVATSLLGGASSFSDKWLGYQQKGVFA